MRTLLGHLGQLWPTTLRLCISTLHKTFENSGAARLSMSGFIKTNAFVLRLRIIFQAIYTYTHESSLLLILNMLWALKFKLDYAHLCRTLFTKHAAFLLRAV